MQTKNTVTFRIRFVYLIRLTEFKYYLNKCQVDLVSKAFLNTGLTLFQDVTPIF